MHQHASRGATRKNGVASNGLTYGIFFAPWTKTKPQGKWIYWTCSGCLCSADKAFNDRLMINSEIPPHAPFFFFETGPSSWLPMKWFWFMEHCNEVWLKNNLAPLTGHSFCIGRTTHLLLLGVDPFIVMVQGCWKSDAFLAYWCHCEEILPLFIGNALTSSSSIVLSMHLFKCKLLNSW